MMITKTPLVAVIGDAMEASVFENAIHKSPVPIILKSEPAIAFL